MNLYLYFFVIVRRSQHLSSGRVDQRYRRSRITSIVPTPELIREELNRTWHPPRAELRVNRNTGEREVASSVHIGVSTLIPEARERSEWEHIFWIFADIVQKLLILVNFILNVHWTIANTEFKCLFWLCGIVRIVLKRNIWHFIGEYIFCKSYHVTFT